jgi:carboxyl-terminal processing protease
LKLTLSQFFRINGGSTQNRGVIPDIKFPDHAGTDSYGESEYKNALPWTSIKRSDYNMQGDLTSEIPVLRKSYEAREIVNPEFSFIKEDFDYYKKLKEDKSVSLNESVRKAETKKQEARKHARKLQRESISKGKLNPIITAVNVLYNSEDDVKSEVDTSEDDEELTNTENDSEPAGDFILEEAARIVADLIKLEKSHKLIADTEKKTTEKTL